MADKDTKPDDAPAVAAPVAEAPASVEAGEAGEDAAKKEKGPKAEGKKKGNKKGGKDGKGGEKGKGGGKSKSAPSGPFGHGGSGFRLNVKNFGANMTEEALRELFAPCGTVTGSEVKVREDGKSRGFGFVIMSSEDEANKAISDMNNKDVNGKPLNVSPAERRPQEEGEELAKGKGKGKGKGKKGGEDMWNAQMQAAMFQQQMMAMQWYSYMASMSGADPAAATAPAEAAATNLEYEGSLKSVSAKNGYGFIVCAATYSIYDRDVYVDKEVLPEGSKPPDRVRFTVTLNPKGHPKAATCKLAV